MALPPKEFEEDKEDWLTTYADAITLLMAFFVMLLSFTKYDIPALEEAAAAFKVTIGKQDQATSPIQLLKLDVEDVVYNMQADQVVKVDKDDKGVVIELSSSAFYKPGSADIRDEAAPVLEKISQTLKAPRFLPYVIDVEGHTDDDPIATDKFPSNWELSAVRATRVVRFFAEQGIDAIRMKATGFAEIQPKAPNRDAEGKPIKENQSKNRRVAVRVYPMQKEQREAYMLMVELRNKRQQGAAGAQS
ncbi:MAG: OmpA family protein, partial [Rhodospirillales bacterium]|nr:OmpA family protein [Rhodospirillales bacterium]